MSTVARGAFAISLACQRRFATRTLFGAGSSFAEHATSTFGERVGSRLNVAPMESLNAGNLSERRPLAHLILLGVATVLVVNPVVVFLLTGSGAAAVALGFLTPAVVVALASRRRMTVLAVLAFNVVVLVSAAAHAELVLLVLLPDRVVPNLYAVRDGYYNNQPLLALRFRTAEYSAEYHTNVQGFRIAERQNPRDTLDTADWLVVGDSFTQGAQVDFEEMFSTLLYRRFPDKIVVNAGISGLGLGQEFNYFMAEGRRLKPAMVVLVLSSFNDFMNVEAPRAGPVEYLMAASALARLLLTPGTDGEDLPLRRWTEPFQSSHEANVDFNVFYKETSVRKKRDLDAFEERLTAFAAAVRSGGGRLVVALLPTREQVQPRSLEEVVGALNISRSDLDLQRPNRIAKDVTSKLGVGLLDLLPAFSEAGDGLFFEQDVHLTSRGHQIVARALGEYLELLEGRSLAMLRGDGFGAERYPSFSRDGNQVVFQSVRDGASDLRIADAQLKNARWLTATGTDEAHPTLSRDNSSLVFTLGIAETLRTDVVLMNLKTSKSVELTPGDSLFGAIPTFSRTGRQLAFAEWSVDSSVQAFSQPQIAVLELASGTKTLLTSSQLESWRPVFSHTDTELAFIQRIDGQFDILLYDLTKGSQTNLTNTPYDEWDPQYTPDGQSVVYAANPDGNWDLFSMELSTRQVRRLTTTRGDEWDPTFSPDGRRLLYGGRFGSFQVVLERPFQP